MTRAPRAVHAVDMANGDGEFDQNDVAGWAQNRSGGGGSQGSGEEADEGADQEDEGGGGGSDPCDILKKIGEDVGASVSKMEGITLPDDEDEKFSDAWEEILEDSKALQEKIADAVEAHEELHEDDEEDDEDDEEEDDEGKGEEDEGGDGGKGDGGE